MGGFYKTREATARGTSSSFHMGRGGERLRNRRRERERLRDQDAFRVIGRLPTRSNTTLTFMHIYAPGIALWVHTHTHTHTHGMHFLGQGAQIIFYINK